MGYVQHIEIIYIKKREGELKREREMWEEQAHMTRDM